MTRIAHASFLVEEPSMEAALERLVPRICPELSYDVHPFPDKPTMLRQLPDRLRAYRKWLPADHCLVVLLDRDGEDCKTLKKRLEAMASSAGFATRSSRTDWQVANRIVVEELEAWYFGDWSAVCAAYPGVSANVPQRAGFRNPDAIRGGTWEQLERILQRAGHFKNGLRKIQLAGTVAIHMNPETNVSPSFQAFRDVVLEICRGDAITSSRLQS
jgi:hypothetical protein